MSALELLLLLPLVGAMLWLLATERSRRKKVMYDRLRFLREKTPEPTLVSRIPWQELSRAETRFAAAAVLLSLVLVFMLNLPWWMALVQLVIVCPLAWILVRKYRMRRFRARFADRFPEAVDGLTRAVQAGVPLERALASLGDMFEGEIAERFQRLVQQMDIGVSFREALDNFSESLDLPDVDYFCAVLALNRETGSPLSPMLISLSKTLSERRAVGRKLQALTAESRASARVLSFLPLFIIGLQAFLNPKQLQFLINDPTGRVVIGYCAFSMAIGLLIIRRMSRLADK